MHQNNASAKFAIGEYKTINVLTGTLALPKFYQRNPRKGEHKLTAKNFDMRRLEPLIVS